MFDTGLVMKHKKNSNPYGLSREDGHPLTRSETIGFFKLNKVSDEELRELNSYIREDNANNTYYDNYWQEFDELGNGCSYIEGMRRHHARIGGTDDEDRSLIFPCEYEGMEWHGKIVDLVSHQEYIEFSVMGKGSLIKTYAGDTGEEIWACFPTCNRGCSLADPSDTYRNSEKLFYIFESIPDGITVANAIRILGDSILKKQGLESDSNSLFSDDEWF